MKYLITENQYEKIRNQVLQSIETVGFNETTNRYKLGYEGFNKIFQGTELPEFSGWELKEIIFTFFKKKWLNEDYKDIKGGKIYFDIDEFMGSVWFKRVWFKNNHRIDGYATPYHDGDFKLLLDADFYSYDDEEGEARDIEITSQYFEKIELPEYFSSFKEIKEWIEDFYVKTVIDYTNSVYKEMSDYRD